MPPFLKPLSAFSPLIPYVMMGFITLGSFSLLHNTGKSSVDLMSATSSAAHDYYLTQFSSSQYAQDGHLKLKIFGDTALHYAEDDYMSIKGIQLVINRPDSDYRGRSQMGQLYGVAERVILSGDVQVQRYGMSKNDELQRTTYLGNHLELTQYPEVIKSNSPILIEQHDRRITAESMLYDSDGHRIQMNGRVRIELKSK